VAGETVNARTTGLAAANVELPACVAVTTHRPVATTAKTRPVSAHTPVVVEENDTGRFADVVADNTMLASPIDMSDSEANEMV
jgi:hypothetical protein